MKIKWFWMFGLSLAALLCMGFSDCGGIDESALDDLEIDLSKVGDLSGVVVDAQTSQPVEGAIVKAGDKTGITDNMGVFLLQNLKIGTHTLTVQAQGYQSHSGSIEIQQGANAMGEIAIAELPQDICEPACGDGLFCNGDEICVEGTCQAGVPVDCDDGNPDTTDTCDEGLDACLHDSDPGGDPDIELSVDTVVFAEANVGEHVVESFQISNAGDADLEIQNIEVLDFDPMVFALEYQIILPVTVSAGDSLDVLLSFTPPLPGSYTSTVRIESNDPDEPAVEVLLLGDCQDQPDTCDGVTCSGHGTCVEDGGEVSCLCDTGYVPVGLTCVPTDVCVPACDDGLYCNGDEICVDSTCQAGIPVDCDDGNPGTTDTCDEAIDACVHE